MNASVLCIFSSLRRIAAPAHGGAFGPELRQSLLPDSGWTQHFYKEHLDVPLLKDIPLARRPAHLVRLGLAGRPLRRLLAGVLMDGFLCFAMVAIEGSSQSAATQLRCRSRLQMLGARSVSAGVLVAGFEYSLSLLLSSGGGVEFLPWVHFYSAWAFAAAFALGTCLWAAVHSWQAASGLPFPVGPGATEPPPNAVELAGLCQFPDPADCGRAAMRRLGVLWAIAVGVDWFVAW